jgi:hypothetical protein
MAAMGLAALQNCISISYPFGFRCESRLKLQRLQPQALAVKILGQGPLHRIPQQHNQLHIWNFSMNSLSR